MENSDNEYNEKQEQQQFKSSSDKKKSNRSPPYALFNLLVIVVAIIYGCYHQFYIKDAENKEPAEIDESDDLVKIPMFTAEELKKYNGEGKRNH